MKEASVRGQLDASKSAVAELQDALRARDANLQATASSATIAASKHLALEIEHRKLNETLAEIERDAVIKNTATEAKMRALEGALREAKEGWDHALGEAVDGSARRGRAKEEAQLQLEESRAEQVSGSKIIIITINMLMSVN
jgi:hypothetical protein